jgi:tetratricopeptide (TPR) repeat protein
MDKSINQSNVFVTCYFVLLFCLFFGSARCLGQDKSFRSGWALDAVVAASNALNDIERVYPDGGDAVIKGIASLGKAHMDALQYAEAEEVYGRAVELHKSVFKNISGDFRHSLMLHVRLLSALADSQMKQGDFDGATDSYRRGLHSAKLGIGVTTPEVKHMRTGLVLAIARRSTNEYAESLFKQLLASSETASGFISDDVAVILDNWIEFRGYTGRLSECEDMSVRLVDVLRRVYGSDHPEVAEALNRQASVIYSKSGNDIQKRKQALPLLQKSYQIRRAAFGASHRLTKLSQKNIGTLQDELK